MRLTDLRRAIDAAIAVWGDRPITTRDIFFSERGPREVDVSLHEAQVGILQSLSDGTPTEWVSIGFVDAQTGILVGRMKEKKG